MPQSLFFTYVLLVSQLTTYGRANRIVTQIIPDNDLRNNCAFELEGHGYDLCPLIEESVLVKVPSVVMSDHVDRGEGSSSGSRFYYVALGGLGDSAHFAEDSSRLEGSECDEDTWVCLLDYEDSERRHSIAGSLKNPPRTYPISRKTKRSGKAYTLKSTASLDIGDEDTDTSFYPLRLSLYGGFWQKRRQAAEITFLCSGEERLKYVGEDKGVHSFSWATSYGCPVHLGHNTSLHLVANEEHGSDSEESVPEEKKGDDDLLPPNNNKTRRWIAIIVVVLVSGLVCGSILLSSTRARSLATENLKGATYTIIPLLSQAAKKLRPIGSSLNSLTTKSIVRLGSRFRQGDSRLVRWAQEDMSLMESEDVMVNGSGAFDRDEGWNAGGLDEYIPLTNSPQYGNGRRVRSYGATPDVETFSESGTMSGFARIFRR